MTRCGRVTGADGQERHVSAGRPLPNLRIFLLGGFRVEVEGQPVRPEAWRRRKSAALVKLLALAPGHALHRDQLVDTLWPEGDPVSGANSLREALFVARRALESAVPGAGAVLRLDGERLILNASHVWVDVEAFLAAAASARRSRQPSEYASPLALYAGDLLPEDRYEDWSASRRETLHQEYLDVLREFARLEEEIGRFEDAVATLRRIVALEPADEGARTGLMRLHAALGQRSEALAHYRQLRDALQRELEVAPEPETQRLYHEILSGSRTRSRETPTRPAALTAHHLTHNLPLALTSFIGREAELAELERLLVAPGAPRLLTLTGPGGSGKTRLALAVATALASSQAHPDGVWLVELASLTDPALLPDAVRRAIGLQERPDRRTVDVLIETLRDKQLLLVLDNCEHLIDAVAELAGRLLASAPTIQVLATSRESLRLPGERPWPLASLELPLPTALADTGDTVADALASPAVQLFVARASAVRPGFALTPATVDAVVTICRRLDGLPLAIELAAARVGVLSVESLASRLDNALALLSAGHRGVPPRQQTLRATLDWSYQLLSAAEQTLLRRLAVFAGAWQLEDAEAVVADDLVPREAVLELLAGLVEKSLVRVELDQVADVRYALLETVRQYADERLVTAGEAEVLRQRHAEQFQELGARAKPELRGPRQVRWFERLEREHDNLRAALLCLSLNAQHDDALKLAVDLWWFWYTRGHVREGAARLRALLAAAENSVPVGLRAEGTLAAGVLTWRLRDYPEARRLVEEAREVFATVGDALGQAWALSFLANIAGSQQDDDAALRFGEEALALFRELGDRVGLARVLNGLAEAARYFGDDARARAFYEEGLALDREAGNQQGVALKLQNLAHVALHEGRLEEAVDQLGESLTLHEQIGHRAAFFCFLEGMAAITSAAGLFDEAAVLYGAWQALATTLDSHALDPPDQRDADHYLGLARERLEPERFAAAWERGQNLSFDEAMAAARTARQLVRQAQLKTEGECVGVASVLERLSQREREVLAVLARGATNREIASMLGIAPRTVDTHVGAILRKLGVATREDAGRLAIDQGLAAPDDD